MRLQYEEQHRFELRILDQITAGQKLMSELQRTFEQHSETLRAREAAAREREVLAQNGETPRPPSPNQGH